MPRGNDLVGLTVLAVLTIRDSHPYELQQFIVNTQKDYVTGLPRSLYHAVDRLVAAGLIEPTTTERDGRRPERTVYRVTEPGRAHLTTRLAALIEVPSPDRRDFTAALSLLGGLPVPDAKRALEKRASALTDTLRSLTGEIDALRASGLPDLVLLKLEHEVKVQEAERDWISTVLDRVDAGALDWPDNVRADLLSESIPETANETEK